MGLLRHAQRNLVAYVALFIALGGVSWAATSLPRDSVGTLQLKNDAVTSAKVRNGTLRAADFRAGQLPAGPTGPAGPVGPQGPPGPAASAGPLSVKAFAAVDGTGSVRRQYGVNNVTRLSAGQYEVPTDIPDTSKCAAVASTSAYNGAVNNRYASASFNTAPDKKIIVGTFNAAGAAVDSDFNLIVVCPT